MTKAKTAWTLMSHMLRKRKIKRKHNKELHRWYKRRNLLDADLDRDDRADWIAVFIVTILNVALWGWFFYYTWYALKYVGWYQ